MSSNQTRRPSFYEGQYLGAADLTTSIDYGRIENARHSLGAHTWGIAAGLEITEKDSAAGGGQVDVFIQPGYAWDGFGRPIAVLTPTKIPAELFKSIEFNLFEDTGPPPGRRVRVWLRYDESATQSPGPGFERCGENGAFARIGETFRIEIGAQPDHGSHAPISVAGHTVDAKDMLQRLNPGVPATELFDESIPYQDFPIDNPRARWLIPLGEVRWLPNSNPNQAGKFVKREADDLTSSSRLRRHIGVVAGAVEAADGLIRLRNRTAAYSTKWSADPAQQELVWVEGKLRVEGDARLFSGKLEFRNQIGVNNNNDPVYLSRSDATSVSSLQAVIGAQEAGANMFIVGPLKAGDVAPKLVVRDNGRIGMGTKTPDQNVTIKSDSDAFLNIKANNAQEILIGADGNGGIVSTMSDHDLHLRAGNNRDRMIIKKDGKVGIGTNAPAGTLTLQGFVQPQHGTMTLFSQSADIEYDGGNDGLFIFKDTGGRTAFIGGNIGIGTGSPAGRLTIEGINQPQQGSLTFFSATADVEYDGGIDRLFIFKDTGGRTAFMGGNIGIGTTNPAGRLTLEGAVPQHGTITFFPPGADFQYNGGSDGLFIFQDNGGRTAFTGGFVGIGTTSPLERLHVAGSLRVENNAFRHSNSHWDLISDESLKENIAPLESALDKLLQLRGVTFTWKEPQQFAGATGPQKGFIAQEVEKVFPDWVTTTSDGFKAVSLKGFEAFLIEALRELKSSVDALAERVTALEEHSTTTKKKKAEPKS